MPQIWSVFVPDVKEYCRVKCKESRTRGPMKVDPTAPINFWNRLVRYDTKDDVHSHVQTDHLIRASTKPQTTPLLHALPIEILREIIGKLDRTDILSVGITCQDLLDLAMTSISDDLRAGGSWTGKPLATISSYTTSLPPPFFEGGLAYKAAGRHDLIDQDPDNGVSFQPQMFRNWPARQWTDSMVRVSKDVSGEQLGVRAWIEALRKVISSGLGSEQVPDNGRTTPVTLPLTDNEIARIEASTFVSELAAVQTLQNLLLAYMEIKPGASSESSGGWCLRNLTTHELVQICICGDEPHVWLGETRDLGPGSLYKTRLSLDDLLVAQTHWTRYEEPHRDVLVSHVQDGSAMSRSWAGHSFDIVSEAKHEEEYPCVLREESAVRLENSKRVKLRSQPDTIGTGRPWRVITGLVHLRSSDST
ncbi:hypothetical protein LTR70_007461 [Exophiala xenobiotica]|uniref:F-box domain-containing protein n=1 Tax=Lithohypha guttulata TaxID=1690604 RepID=A0ABR0KNZ0_9EURO|nr:hypothetical protein LTR24_000382 [Lithohypha guttulata]KAK5313692.1 hypothetical protein LTR70_007461 [Exophiala xenobiotica]